MNHSTGKPVKHEQKRIDSMLRLGCVACAVIEIPYAIAEVHHLLDGGHRMGHWYTIPLCSGHHRGVWSLDQRQAIERYYRIAISDGRKVFVRIYGTERSLWERVQRRLKLTCVWPPTKILPRRVYVERLVDENSIPLVDRTHPSEETQGISASSGLGAGARLAATERKP